jgi:hypothetical protein
LSGLAWSTNYTWTAYWKEGDYRNNYNDSHILLQSHGYGWKGEIEQIWIAIPKDNNRITPICGQPLNSPSLGFSMNNSYFSIPRRPFAYNTPIGFQCNCNKHGKCNYCTRQCDCDDGYGSSYDRLFSLVDDFQPDCSSKTCPIGLAIGDLYHFENLSTVLNVFNSSKGQKASMYNAHRLRECSNNGNCNRQNGKCQCNKGFTGSACEKQSCPGSPLSTCSGNGKCYSISRLAKIASALPLSSVSFAYDLVSMTSKMNESNWDVDFGHACVCDSSWEVGLGAGETQLSEYFGVACQNRHCPSGRPLVFLSF